MRWETEQEQQNIVGCKCNISCSGEGSSAASTMASKKQTQLGPINLYFTKESNEAMQQRKGKEAKVIDEAKKKLRENAVQKICRWMYDAGLPFNAVNYESLGQQLKLLDNGWTDRKHRSLINFLVNSPKGTKFIGSVDASSYSHTAHCIDLMFEDFFKVPNLKKTYEQFVMINGYIYNRSPLLDMLRDFIVKRDMVRSAKIRFATAFLTLKRFHTEKANLKKMFTSEKWTKSKYAKEAQGKLVASTILKNSFWNNILYILKVAGPLVKVLRLVDGEKKPPMGYIYEAMDMAKEAIAASFSNVEEKYQKKIDIIDARWDIQLHRPLHTTGYYLNPEFYYSSPSVEQDKEVMGGLFKCIERLIPDGDMQDKLIEELLHTKRRNRLEQKRLNDLVYIKYNRALRRRYDARDTIDPIALDDIDESNEWLLGRLNLSEEDGDEENARVFEDDDLTWGDVA
ncbi:UNVERIFIED_CONTAM: hypothetical protein Slati_3963000 [Sesamum latifolium]|uniref:DUF659 domain-containing protein n=1 Tax=Sesamum latifolium TaxID=2727402 RepID=A0AAW2TNR8_9LAMI